MIWVKSLNNEVIKLFSDRQYLADQQESHSRVSCNKLRSGATNQG